jgi:hypothetical protein
MEHLCLETVIHAVLVPFCIGIEVKVPVVDSRDMNAIPLQFNHIHMIAAILIAFLVFDDNEERVWRYGIGSTHNTMQKSSVYPAGLLHFAIPEG